MNWDWDKLKEQQQKQQRSRQQQPPPEPEGSGSRDEKRQSGNDNKNKNDGWNGWGSGNGGDGGNNRNNGNHRGTPIPPNLDDMVNKLKKAGNFKFKGWGYLIAIIIIIVIALTSFYTVNQDEVGVVLRFGKYVKTEQPGLNWKLPFGIETVTKVNVKRVRTMEFGSESRYETTGNPVSLMLTGDLNVGLVPWIVQYQIKEPRQYLFKVADVNRLLGDMSEATMRLIVGDRSINEVISKREEIAVEARLLLQRELDKMESGVQIVTIEMKRTTVPDPVQPSFNEVNQATQEKEQMIYQAREDYNKAIPAARGEAERTILAAQGYALDRVNRAQGDVSRFMNLYAEYRLAEDVTKQRLYLEAMQQFLPNIGSKYIIDAEQSNLLPFLNMTGQGGLK